MYIKLKGNIKLNKIYLTNKKHQKNKSCSGPVQSRPLDYPPPSNTPPPPPPPHFTKFLIRNFLHHPHDKIPHTAYYYIFLNLFICYLVIIILDLYILYSSTINQHKNRIFYRKCSKILQGFMGFPLQVLAEKKTIICLGFIIMYFC